jgi:hypothetical protein
MILGLFFGEFKMFKQLLIFVLFSIPSLVCAETTLSSKVVVSIDAKNGNSASAAAGNGTVIITDMTDGNIDIKIEVVTDEDFDVFDNDDFFK